MVVDEVSCDGSCYLVDVLLTDYCFFKRSYSDWEFLKADLYIAGITLINQVVSLHYQ